MMTMKDVQGESASGHLLTIGEAADLSGVSVQTLRYYEREGLIIPYHRESKHRRYSNDDIERVRCMRVLIKQENVRIEGIKRLLAMTPCWSIKGCSPESREGCEATKSRSTACWMVANKSRECRNAECRVCPVYAQATDCEGLKRALAQSTAVLSKN